MDRGNKCCFSHHPTHNQAIRKLHPTTCRTESESNPGSPPPLPPPLCQQPRLSPGPAAQPHPCSPGLLSAPLCLLSARSRRGAIKTEGRACPPLLPALQGCSLHPGAAAQHLCCLGISCTFLSLQPRKHASPSPTTGPLPMLHPLPETLFSRSPLDLASFRSLLICEYLPFKHLDPLHTHFYLALSPRG